MSLARNQTFYSLFFFVSDLQIVTIFDAEDDIAPHIFNMVNTAMIKEAVGIVRTAGWDERFQTKDADIDSTPCCSSSLLLRRVRFCFRKNTVSGFLCSGSCS